VFEELSRQANATLPPELGYIYVNYAWNLNISTTDPVLLVTLNYAGDRQAAAPYADPFKSFNPVSTEEGEVPYDQIAAASGTDVADPLCNGVGVERLLFASDLLIYNVSTNRALYDLFKNVTTIHPEYQGSFAIFESYSQQGVKAVHPDSTAFPNRESNIVFTLAIEYDQNPDFDQRAIAWGEQTRSLMHAGQAPGSNLQVYVNYAFGSETLESMYGYEPWRLEKLRSLKKEWDVYNKFGFYLPIS